MDSLLTGILSDISNFALVIFGFCATLYTVIYSFILNKKDLLKEISEAIKTGEKVVLQTQKEQNYINYIRKMRTFNKYIIVCLWTSLIIYVFSLVVKYLRLYKLKIDFLDHEIEGYLVYLLLLFTICLFTIIVVLINRSIRTYNKTTNV